MEIFLIVAAFAGGIVGTLAWQKYGAADVAVAKTAIKTEVTKVDSKL